MNNIDLNTELVFDPHAMVVYRNPTTQSLATITANMVTHMAFTNKGLHRENDDLRSKIAAVKDYIVENWEECDGAEWVQDVSKMLGINLTKEVSIKVTIEAEFDIEVPLGFDETDLNAGDFTWRVTYDNEGDHEVTGYTDDATVEVTN